MADSTAPVEGRDGRAGLAFTRLPLRPKSEAGAHGVYNLLHPKEAEAFLDRKLARVAETNAEIVVSGNPGCTLQMQAGLRARGEDVRVLHPVELVDWSLRGGRAAPSPWELGR